MPVARSLAMKKTRLSLLACTFAFAGTLLSAPASSQEPAPRRVPVASLASVATPEQRKDMTYLASCALGADTVLVAEVDGEVHEFPGAIGLAPEWWRRPLTPEEERWVSACLLARTNFYGVRVEISLHTPFPTEAPGLRIEEEEARSFAMEEATFFGNVFGQSPAAYVCGGNDDTERQARIRAHRRICALPLAQHLPDGRQVTACGFIYLGPCTDSSFNQDGIAYREAVAVSLRAAP